MLLPLFPYDLFSNTSDNFTSLHSKNQSPHEDLQCCTLTSSALYSLLDHSGHFAVAQTYPVTTNLRNFVQSFSLPRKPSISLIFSRSFSNCDLFSKLYSDHPLKFAPPDIFNPCFPTLYFPIALVIFKKKCCMIYLFILCIALSPCSNISSTRARTLDCFFFHWLIPRT